MKNVTSEKNFPNILCPKKLIPRHQKWKIFIAFHYASSGVAVLINRTQIVSRGSPSRESKFSREHLVASARVK